MHRALLELTIDGIETSREFHLRVMEDAEFRAGEIDIQWLERRLPSLLNAEADADELRTAAIAAALIADAERRGRLNGGGSNGKGAARVAVEPAVENSAWAQLARVEGVRDR